MPDYLLRKNTGELELVTGTEPFTVTPGGGSGTYDVYRLDNSASVTVTGSDVQAPLITGLTATVTNNQATLQWSTDEANGMTYWVCTGSQTQPAATQIAAGQDHTGAPAEASGTQPVTATGAQSTASIDGLQDGQTYSFHLMQQDASGNISGILTDSVTVENTTPSIPVLSELTATPTDTSAAFSFTTDTDNGNAYWVLTTSDQVPEFWRVRRGQDHTGVAALRNGSHRVTSAGIQSDIVVADLDAGTTYHFHIYHGDNSGNASAVYSVSVTLEDAVSADTTAPTLSGVSASISGTTATLRWSSDEGNGTGYWVCTTSATVPSETQIIAGEDHTGVTAVASGAQAVSSAGSQADQVVTGLTEGPTYFFHLLQQDASGNTSTGYSTAGVTVATSGASAEISIFNRSQLQIAPSAVSMEISVSGFDTQGPAAGEVYDPRLHDLYYFWDFDESYTFSAPENLVDAHKNSGVGYGPKVTHTYRTPGTYTASCLVVEPSSGKSAIAELQINVGNSDNAFPSIRTIFVSPSSDFADAPAGARLAQSLDQAFGMFAGNDQVPTRVMLNRGETYTFGGRNFGLGGGTSIPSTHIVAGPGSASNPLVVMTGSFDWNDKSTSGNGADKDFIWQNIDFSGPWDSVAEAGSNLAAFNHYDNSPRQHLFDGCSFDGFDIAIYAADNDPNITHRFIALNDCSITNWRSYGILYSIGVGLSLVGTKIFCHPQAGAGGPQDGQHNNQGPLRFHRGDRLLISNCDFFNRIGWSPVGPFQSIQPCVRQNVAGDPGYFSTIQASSFEAGAGLVEYTVEEGLTSGPINALVEKCYLLGNHQTWGGVRSQMGGLTVRNNLIVFPGAARDASIIDPAGFMEVLYLAGGIPETYSAPVRFYNNTCVNLMDDADYVGTSRRLPEFIAPSQFINAAAGNNLFYQPHINNADTIDGPVETSPALWTARDIGYRSRTTSLISSTATPPETAASFRPQIGSDALGDALNGDVAYDDFFGNVRPQYPSRGALEAA